METFIPCPTCGTKHLKDVRHEWPTVEGRRQLDLELRSQSVNVDHGKLEWLCPSADDGQEIAVTVERLNEGGVMLHITRKPRATGGDPKTPPMPKAKKPTRAEMVTEAAEIGFTFNPKLTDEQLAVALAKFKAEKQD